MLPSDTEELSDPRCITTPRLLLVLLDRAYLEAVTAGQAPPDRGFIDPYGFLDGAEDVAELRLRQIDEDAAAEPWLLRAIVTRDDRIAVGFLNFHAPPDARGMVEIGYEVLTELRGLGYASEAAAAMIAWAAQHGARVVRACVSPDNAASLAMIERLGFAQVGEQLDDVDGLELVFEKHVTDHL